MCRSTREEEKNLNMSNDASAEILTIFLILRDVKIGLREIPLRDFPFFEKNSPLHVL
jgi:hypothetical protein